MPINVYMSIKRFEVQKTLHCTLLCKDYFKNTTNQLLDGWEIKRKQDLRKLGFERP